MTLTGRNEFGLYETKEDKKVNTIEALKKWEAEFEKAETPRQRSLATQQCTRLERILMVEYKMTEVEVFKATH